MKVIRLDQKQRMVRVSYLGEAICVVNMQDFYYFTQYVQRLVLKMEK